MEKENRKPYAFTLPIQYDTNETFTTSETLDLKKTMKRIRLISVICLWAFVVGAQQSPSVFNIKNYGARGDGKTVNTQAINKAVTACADAGGGTVVVPAGIFLTGTVQLKSHVTLMLEKGAVIKGVTDLEAYLPYVPTREMGKYDNANKFRWNRALILGVGVADVAITGSGTIDGDHVVDPQGEERMRGPHTVLFAESRNLSFSGVTVNNAANYAFMAYEIENAVYHNLTVNQGWDGIHIRGGKHVIIRNSSFYTGDDAIAGGYWEDMVITDCHINSSCNGIRMIMPADGLNISHCTFAGPGRYPHRTSKERNRTNMLSAILLQPGGWGRQPGIVDRVHIHDIDICNVNNPLMFVLNEGNSAGKILVERLKAVQVNAYASSVESWKGGMFDEVTFRDITIEYAGHPGASPTDEALGQPHVDARNLPCWGWLVRNVKSISFENVDLRYTGDEPRPAFYFDNAASIQFDGVKYPGHENAEAIVFKNSGSWTVDGQAVNRNRSGR